MTGAAWATTASVVVFVAALALLTWDRRATRQALRNCEGAVAGLTLDLQAARDKIVELQGYLAEHDSWQVDGARPVPARLADPTVPDRWSTRSSTPQAAGSPTPRAD